MQFCINTARLGPYRPRMAHDNDPEQEEADLAVRVVEELRGWYESIDLFDQPEAGQDVQPDAGAAPTFTQEYARSAARRRLDEQDEGRWMR
jgi:hypothetical protein